MTMDRLFLELHILQSVPPSNMNRDDTGSPKTAFFGGVPRARVSSQAWKKATRIAFGVAAADLATSGVVVSARTKHLVDMMKKSIINQRPDLEQDAENLAVDAIQKTLGKGSKKKTGIFEIKDGHPLTTYLLGVTAIQAEKMAALAIAGHESPSGFNANEGELVFKDDNAIDVALFGRMVTHNPSLNMDAACQVAHAIGIHRTITEFDYFTAMDDLSPDETPGADMIGTVEFSSSTLYRYATIDVPHLWENLGKSIEATTRSVRAFVEAFVTSMPTGKQNTFANRTLPLAVLVQLRSTQPVSLVNAFEQPIEAQDGKGRTQRACEALVRQEHSLDEAFGVTPDQAFAILGTDDALPLLEIADRVTLSELSDRLGKAVQTWGQG